MSNSPPKLSSGSSPPGERQWTGSEPPALPGRLEPRVSTADVQGSGTLVTESRRIPLGPLPPAPRPPNLAPERGPTPYRGRLPTRDEVADHFAARPPGLMSPGQAHAAFRDSAAPGPAPRIATPETLRPLTTTANEAPSSGAQPAASGTHLPIWRRTPAVIALVAALSSMVGMAAVWSAQPPRPNTPRPIAVSAAAVSSVTTLQEPQGAQLAINPSQLPAAPDGLFAVRTPQSALPCDAALGRPFVAQSKPSPGRSSALWSQSRRSLLANREPLALTQMCQSASWDLAGRGAYGLVEYYYQASDFQQALQWAERIPKRSPRYLDARGMIGDIYNQRGDIETALSVYADTWNFQPQDTARRAEVADGFLGGAVYALEHGDAWSAERYARRAIVLNPSNSRAALTLANAFARFDLREASLGWAERARELEQ